MQSVQAPDPPHALLAVPGAQPDPLQQPPLQGWVPVHAEPHFFVAVLQAVCVAQSVVALQPHTPVVRQAVPFALLVQSTHTVPAAPHSVVLVPGWQLPLVDAEQQPEPHIVVAEQELTHRCLAPSQELAPVAQSASVPQPHCPPPGAGSQRCPLALLAHAAHTAPVLPHAASPRPV